MARTKKKKYRVRYSAPNRDTLILQGYNSYQLNRHKKILKAYSDDQALALANMHIPSVKIEKYRPVSIGTGSYDQRVIRYRVETLVEIIERVVPV